MPGLATLFPAGSRVAGFLGGLSAVAGPVGTLLGMGSDLATFGSAFRAGDIGSMVGSGVSFTGGAFLLASAAGGPLVLTAGIVMVLGGALINRVWGDDEHTRFLRDNHFLRE